MPVEAMKFECVVSEICMEQTDRQTCSSQYSAPLLLCIIATADVCDIQGVHWVCAECTLGVCVCGCVQGVHDPYQV